MKTLGTWDSIAVKDRQTHGSEIWPNVTARSTTPKNG